MSLDAARPSWRILFREEQGRIGAADWRRGALVLALTMAAMTIAWIAMLPYANRDLTERKFIDPAAIGVYAYLMIYAAAIMLAAVCFYFLSVKRWRDLARPPALAGLPLFAALVTGAAHWLQPRVSEVMPWFIVGLCDVALAAIVVWHVLELGFRASPERREP